ncbi:hypothetical protein RP20_CCG018256 [Aedes albopictus]|nr:hypothetical protein RP20_CCG018256 [Aedes albopictus]
MNHHTRLIVLLVVNILGYTIAEVRSKRQILEELNSLGPGGNKSLGDYVDFRRVLRLDYGNPIPRIRKSYDFIVVGAGPAGCSVANHLSENPTVTVLLLDLGKPEISIMQDVPATNIYQVSTAYNFAYVSEPQAKGCLGMKEHRCAWHHGRGLGGSTLINNMIYTRGNWRDYDSWNASGNVGWSYEEVLPYFIRAEKENLRDFGNNGYHGKRGYLLVEDIAYRTPLASTFVKSAQANGMPYIDYNSRDQMGVSYVQSLTNRGIRWSAARALLHPIRRRQNLHVVPEAWVTNVLIDKETKTALGVRYTRNGMSFTVMAKKEVILSAGAFGSAQLLMLSGVGPKDHLSDMGIELIQNLPVGETLYEHPGAIGPVFTIGKHIDNLINFDYGITVSSAVQYLFGRGMFTCSLTESLGYLKSTVSPNSDPAWPDVELIQIAGTIGDDSSPSAQNYFRITDEIMTVYFKPLFTVRAFMYLPMLMHPRTKGSLKLRSTDPYEPPLFNYTYFEDDRDLQALVEGIKEAVKITSQKPFLDIDAKLYSVKVPGCEEFEFNTDNYWRCHVKVLTTTYYHYVATCKMGPETDPTAVVDPRLRVYGMKKLRVVDIGIIPKPPTAHTTAIAYMIGDKASDMIKEDNNL